MYEATMLLLTLAGIQLVALISPGPDFFLITQVAVSHSRREAFMAVFGVTIGVAVWALIALLGLHLLVEQFPWIQGALYLAGGSYLSYLGLLLLKSGLRARHQQKQGIANNVTEKVMARIVDERKGVEFLFKGLLTNLANPKALIYFGSVFVLFVGDNISNIMRVEIFALVVILTFLWFAVVAILFSLPKPKAIYQKLGAYIDATAGALFLLFGLNLLYQGSTMLL